LAALCDTQWVAGEGILIAQLTDTHVVAWDTATELYVDNNARLAEAVESLNQESPQPCVVLLTGDLVNDAQPSEYAALSELLAPLTVPVLALPGNHDDRELVRSAFPGIEWCDARHASWVAVVGGVRVIGLDSTRPGEHGGEFDDERAEWLAGVLDQDHSGVTLLAMHHPPFASGIEWMDRYGFAGLDRLRSIIDGSAVDSIVCGHLHRPITSSVAGVRTQVGMSTVQHVLLDLEATSRPSLIRDPVGYQIHRVAGSTVVTHARYIATGETAFVPSWADGF
jgi:3',5'-cyclic AMP phosphodiesterase CpdA